MKLQSITWGVAAAALAALSVVSLAGQADLTKAAKLRSVATFNETAPATFKANFDTSKGLIVIEAHRDWAPLGADRFYNLVKNGFYDDIRFYRVIPGFMAQFGLHGNVQVQTAWRGASLKDEPAKQSNMPGYVTFANGGASPDCSRSGWTPPEIGRASCRERV